MKKVFYFTVLIFGISYFANAQSTKVLIETSMGNMTVVLYDETPEHRDNFIKLANQGFYEDLLFHRVINGFMIQAGDPDSKNAPANKPLGNGGPGYTIPAEFNTKYFHKKGALSAARTGDHINPEKRSSGSQFYIVQGMKYTDMQMDSMEKQLGRKFSKIERDTYYSLGGTPYLDTQYTVFGEVTKGLEIIDKIASVKTSANDRPVEDVKILKVSVIK